MILLALLAVLVVALVVHHRILLYYMLSIKFSYVCWYLCSNLLSYGLLVATHCVPPFGAGFPCYFHPLEMMAVLKNNKHGK